ncbi:MAG TPA: nuclear transport factor 2 family protein [Pyrinomonadaceae bacterium]|jgi:hypothetical protein
MKRISTVMLMALAACSIALGQASERRAALNNKVAEEIRRLDREWLIESYDRTNDMSAFDRIVADDFMITHSRGKVLNKAEKRADIIGSHSSPPSPEAVFKIEETSVRVRVYRDVAISTGYIIEKYPYQGKQVNDRVYFTNTYLKRDGRWQVVASQLTRVPQSQ